MSCRFTRASAAASAFVLWVALAAAAQDAAAQDAAAPRPAGGPMRVGGVIDKDVTWHGHVLITERTQIRGATVTVDPSTTIEFAAGPRDPAPALLVGTDGDGGRLLLPGTSTEPITIRTRANSRAGHVVVRVAGEKPLEWTHVRFDGLGHRVTDEAAAVPMPEPRGAARPGGTPLFAPSVYLLADRAGDHVRLDRCEFRGCARLAIRLGGQAVAVVRYGQFRDGIERHDVQVSSLTGGRCEIVANRMQQLVEVTGTSVDVRDNLMIGPNTALSIESESQPPSRIVGNYIHNTTEQDDGRYCLKCRDADAEIRDNVMRGATYVVLEGSRTMTGNVFVANPNLRSQVVRNARTHYLVAALPGRARFEENVLLGPAYALMATQSARRPGTPGTMTDPIRDLYIARNVFDGFGGTGQAIRLNVLAKEPVEARITENLFLRVDAVVLDESRQPGVVREAGSNVIAPRPARVYDGVLTAAGQPLTDEGDRVFNAVADADLPALPSSPPGDWDSEVLAGRLTVEAIRQQISSAYRRRK